MPRLGKDILKKIENLYKTGKYSDTEIAVKAGVNEITVKKQVKKFNWKQEKIELEVKELEEKTNEIMLLADSKDPNIQATIDRLLPKAIQAIEKKLDETIAGDNKIGFRDLSAFTTKLLEMKAKLTGELDKDQTDSEIRRSNALERLATMMDFFDQKGIKKLEASNDYIEINGEIIEAEPFLSNVVDAEIA